MSLAQDKGDTVLDMSSFGVNLCGTILGTGYILDSLQKFCRRFLQRRSALRRRLSGALKACDLRQDQAAMSVFVN